MKVNILKTQILNNWVEKIPDYQDLSTADKRLVNLYNHTEIDFKYIAKGKFYKRFFDIEEPGYTNLSEFISEENGKDTFKAMNEFAEEDFETERIEFFKKTQKDFLTNNKLGILLSKVKKMNRKEDQKGVQKSDKAKKREIKHENKENIMLQMNNDEQKPSNIITEKDSTLNLNSSN